MKRVLFGLLLLAGCGTPTEIQEQESALTQSCNGKSDPECVGLATGATCDGTGKCRPDPDYAGACDCIPQSTTPPPAICYCGTATPGQACGLGGTCTVFFTGMMPYCACR